MQVIIKSQPLEGSVIERDDVVSPEMLTFFKMNPSDVTLSEKKKLKDIESYLSQESSEEVDRWMLLKDIQYRLGSPQLGKSPIDQVHAYIRFKQAARENEAAAKALEQ